MLVDKDVRWFDIPVRNIECLKVLQGLQNLLENLLYFGRSDVDLLILDDAVEVAVHEIETQVEHRGAMVSGLLIDHFVDVEYVGMF